MTGGRKTQVPLSSERHLLWSFTQSISVNVSSNAKPNTRMGPVPIHYTALALPPMLTLCVIRLVHY